MDLSKSYEFFEPEKVDGMIHIIGCGSVGSTLAENLCRCGITKMTLWDFDEVESHNIVNQMFLDEHVGMKKVDALKDLLVRINPECADDVVTKPKGWNGKILSGYIFLAMDNIELRRKFVEDHMNSLYVKAVFDFRTLLEGAQHYAADWSDRKQKENLLKTMQFSNDEADVAVPMSACGYILGVATTVRIVCAIGVNNFINFIKGNGLWTFGMFNGFKGTYDLF